MGTTTLDFERSNIARVVNIEKQVRRLNRYVQARSSAGQPVRDAFRLEMVDRAVETSVCALLSFQVVSIQARGGVPNMEASMNKMYGSELQQRVAATAMHLTGMAGQLRRPNGIEGDFKVRAAMDYMTTVSATIAAGTSEIQRNIIATRGLGLPRG